MASTDGSESASSLKEMDSSTRGKYADEESPASFSILLRTSADSPSSEEPTGRVSVLIRDDEGRASDKQVLRFSHTHPTPFQRGHTDLFVMCNQPSLGPLAFCEIHYKDESGGRQWEHHQVQVFHHENGRLYNFVPDEKQSNEAVSVLVCKDDGVQIVPTELRNPFK